MTEPRQDSAGDANGGPAFRAVHWFAGIHSPWRDEDEAATGETRS